MKLTFSAPNATTISADMGKAAVGAAAKPKQKVVTLWCVVKENSAHRAIVPKWVQVLMFCWAGSSEPVQQHIVSLESKNNNKSIWQCINVSEQYK